MVIDAWHNILKDTPAFILGNGPSLADIDLTLLGDRFTIGINRLLPPHCPFEPTVLFWQDIEFSKLERRNIDRCKAIKVCATTAVKPKHYPHPDYFHYEKFPIPPRLPGTPSKLYLQRAISGTLAFQFAYAIGCSPIVLLGMDCCYRNKGNTTDYYGKNLSHRSGMLKRCKTQLDWVMSQCKAIDIINCSENGYESRRIEDVLAETEPIDSEQIKATLLDAVK